jgi:hypothetical protein
MKVTAWRSGAFTNPSIAYGIRIGVGNRDECFRPEWESVTIEIQDGPVVEALLSSGFWKNCPEIRDPAFREWFRAHGLIPWPSGSPPVFELKPTSGRRFKLSGAHHAR